MGICNLQSRSRNGIVVAAAQARRVPDIAQWSHPARPCRARLETREMKMRTKSWVLALAVGSVSAVTGSALAAGLTPVADANTKVTGLARPNVLSPELAEIVQAQGATPLENGTAAIPFYGYDGDGPMLPA